MMGQGHIGDYVRDCTENDRDGGSNGNRNGYSHEPSQISGDILSSCYSLRFAVL